MLSNVAGDWWEQAGLFAGLWRRAFAQLYVGLAPHSFLFVSQSVYPPASPLLCSLFRSNWEQFLSMGEENLQTPETALVPHTTLNSMIFLDGQQELWVMCLILSSLKILHKIP